MTFFPVIFLLATGGRLKRPWFPTPRFSPRLRRRLWLPQLIGRVLFLPRLFASDTVCVACLLQYGQCLLICLGTFMFCTKRQAFYKRYCFGRRICGWQGSNLRRPTPTGPKPVPFDHSGTPAKKNVLFIRVQPMRSCVTCCFFQSRN